MSYTCITHGWRHLQSPCPSCQKTWVSDTTSDTSRCVISKATQERTPEFYYRGVLNAITLEEAQYVVRQAQNDSCKHVDCAEQCKLETPVPAAPTQTVEQKTKLVYQDAEGSREVHPRSVPYDDGLKERLKDPEFAWAYVLECRKLWDEDAAELAALKAAPADSYWKGKYEELVEKYGVLADKYSAASDRIVSLTRPDYQPVDCSHCGRPDPNTVKAKNFEAGVEHAIGTFLEHDYDRAIAILRRETK